MMFLPVRSWLTCLSSIFVYLCILNCSASLSQHDLRDLELGKEAFTKQNYDEAIVYFKSYLEKSPQDGEAHLQLGRAQLKKGDLREAINQFKESMKLNPEVEATRALIKKSIFDEAHVFLSEGKQEKGMRYLTAYITLNPDDVDTYILLTREFIKMDSTRNAINSLNKAVSIDSTHPEVVELLDYFSDGFH